MGARTRPDRPGRGPERSHTNLKQRVGNLIPAKSLIALIVCQVCGDLSVSGLAPFQIEAVSVAEPATVRSRSAHGHSFVLSLSADGEFALFASSANDILTNDHNAGFVDLFLWRRSDGSVRLVSADVFGAGGGGGHTGHAEVTPDGRYVVFESAADDLVPNDRNRTRDIFLRDMIDDKVVLVSVNATGSASGNGASWNPVITPDGRFVAFVSSASDLVARDNNRIADVFVRDLQAGVTTLVSQNAHSRSSPPYAIMDTPVITPDGRFVAFSSSATGLVNTPQAVYQEIYVRDLLLERTIWASTNLAARGATGFYAPVLSDDGRFAAFKAAAGADVRPWLGVARLFRHDLETGRLDIIPWNIAGIGPTVPDGYGPAMTPDGGRIVFADMPTILGTSSIRLWDAGSGDLRLVSANLAGQPSAGGLCGRAMMTVDGRRVAFASNASDLVTNELRTGFQVYLRDMDSGLTTLVSGDFAGAGVGGVDLAHVISSNGRFIGFETISDGLTADDLNAAYDAFIYDSLAGTTELISRANPACKAVTGNNSSFITSKPVSDDGHLVVFESLAGDIVAGDTNGVWDIFVRDLTAGTNGLVSVNIAGTVSTTGASRSPSISGSGRYVVFISTSEDLVLNDTNRVEDVFVRDLIAGRTTLVSVTPEGYSGNGPSFTASISADGRRVAFQSLANNLATGDGDLIDDIYVRDLVSGVTALVSTNAPEDPGSMTFSNPVLSPDGRFVAFEAVFSSARTVRVVDLEDKTTRKMATNALCFAFSGNGRVLGTICRVGTTTRHQLVLSDLAGETVTAVDLGPISPSSNQGISLSHDGRFVAFSTAGRLAGLDTNGVEDVFVLDRWANNLTLVSTRQTRDAAGNDRSYWPRISRDGRFIAFRSKASDIAKGDKNGGEDVFLLDRQRGEPVLVSRSFVGDWAANGFSTGLAITPDARRIVFGSIGADLVTGDFNGFADVFTVAIPQTTPTDSDSDGLDDPWELRFFGTLLSDGMADPDLDGHTNAQEYKAGTDPTASASVLKFEQVTINGDWVTLGWTATPGRSYKVQYKETLDGLLWEDAPAQIKIVGSQALFTSTTPGDSVCRFYRLLLVE